MQAAALTFVAALAFATHPPGVRTLAYTVEPNWPGALLVELDLSIGSHTPENVVGQLSPDLGVVALALDASGVLFGVTSGDDLVIIDRATAAVSVVGDLGIDVRQGSLTFDACGRLWFLHHPLNTGFGSPVGLYSVNPSSGAATLLHPLEGTWSGLAAFSEGLWSLRREDGASFRELVRIESRGGEVTPLFQPSGDAEYLAFNGDNRLFGLSRGPIIGPPPPAEGYFFDLETGAVTSQAQFGIHRQFLGMTMAPPPGPCSSGCAPGPEALCLQGGRFKAEVEWRDQRGRHGRGRSAPLRSPNSGLFWFFDADNWEMLVKVLDGCGRNGHFWVFFAATTDVELDLLVTDTWTGEQRRYLNPLGHPASTVNDTRAFATCP